MFPNLIIASDLRQAEHVTRWISQHGSGGVEFGNLGSSRPIPQLPVSRLAWTSFGSALHHIEGLRPERIVIVDYLRWRSPIAGEFARVAQAIQRAHAAYGTEVIWW